MRTDRSREFGHREHRPSSRYAEAGDVACDLCEGRKLKALKSCMTCLASFCETHIRDHYTVEALQRHLLVEVTKNLNVLQENAQLKKTIKEERSEKVALRDENQALRKENEALNQKITELRLSNYLCETKTPVAANVEWDPASSHHALILSDDGKQVKLGQSFTALEELTKGLRTETLPRVLGVCTDVDDKWVTFYNTETKAHIYTFEAMDFSDREKIYPVLCTLVSEETG
ncbi:hypothetical protein SRHO_G00329160 [Serrasalmus rhombeus]